MFMRPLANAASALVFFSRRTDLPYHYHSSLARLNFNSSHTYEVSTLLPAGLQISLGGHGWGAAASYRASPRPWSLGPLAGACGAAAGVQGCGRTLLRAGVFRLCKQSFSV